MYTGVYLAQFMIAKVVSIALHDRYQTAARMPITNHCDGLAILHIHDSSCGELDELEKNYLVLSVSLYKKKDIEKEGYH